jgi:hypothetical protein
MRQKLRGPAAVGVELDHVAGVVGIGAAVFSGLDADAAIELVGRGALGGGTGALAKVLPPPSLKLRPLRDSRMSAMVAASSQRVELKPP